MIKIEKNLGNQKKRISNYKLLPIFILIAICFLGIGYASINAITLNITGSLSASPKDEIFISKVVDANDVEITGSYNGTFLNSTIELDSSDITSTKTYYITIFNNTHYVYKYAGAVCDKTIGQCYTNEDIEYTINGISEQEEIDAYSTKDFEITFSYKENLASIENNILTSVIKFEFNNSSADNFDITELGNGEPFNIGNVEFNANTETVYIEMNLRDLPATPIKQNIITIGQSISEWRPTNETGAVNLHLYYPDANNNIIISPTIQQAKHTQFLKLYSLAKNKRNF